MKLHQLSFHMSFLILKAELFRKKGLFCTAYQLKVDTNLKYILNWHKRGQELKFYFIFFFFQEISFYQNTVQKTDYHEQMDGGCDGEHHYAILQMPNEATDIPGLLKSMANLPRALPSLGPDYYLQRVRDLLRL